VKRWIVVGTIVMGLLTATTVALGADSTDVYRTVVAADAMQNDGATGQGQVVAVIDSGIANVPELAPSIITQVNMSGAPDDGDQFGHGTFVAGLIHRTAPDAKLVSVKLSGADGSVDVSQVLAAIEWVVANKDRYGITEINLSFGSDSHQSYRASLLDYAVEQAWNAGIVVVVSAGNLGNAPGTVTKPGDDPRIISVGATDDQMTKPLQDDTIPDFVSRGPTQDGLAKPDVTAPGAHLVSVRDPGSTVDTGYPSARVGTDEFRGSGTSFSAAVVTGVVALLRSAHPDATPDQIKAALMATAHPVSGDPAAQGAGSVDAWAANAQIPSPQDSAQDLLPALGTGTLEADRGSNRVTVPGLLGLRIPVSGALTSANGLLLPLLAPLDPNDWFGFGFDWQASRWGASRWGATQWDASRWGASRWGAAEWYASRWG
jgi:serine protease AprX